MGTDCKSALSGIKENYPNAKIKETTGPGVDILMWYKISDKDKQEYNKKENDDED